MPVQFSDYDIQFVVIAVIYMLEGLIEHRKTVQDEVSSSMCYLFPVAFKIRLENGIKEIALIVI